MKERAGATLRRIGFLSHSLALYPDLTARENLRFFAALYGVKERAKRIEKLLGEVNLLRWADETVRSFSRGMKQRLALARVFLHEPELLLLDEPFTGLDHDSAGALAARIRRAGDDGSTVLLASHRIDIAAPVADRALLLDRGRLARGIDLTGIDSHSRAAAVLDSLESGS